MITAAPAPPAPRIQRPTPVTLACYLLAGVAALRVVSAIAAFYAIPEYTWIYSERYGDTDHGRIAALGIGLLGVCSALVAATYLTLALLDASGKNWARILTWITATLTIAVTALLLATTTATSLPWYHHFTTLIAYITLPLTIAALFLLTRPAADQYFRTSRRPPPPSYRYPPGYIPPYYGPQPTPRPTWIPPQPPGSHPR
ncbi:hypothetical protein [Nocardia macrotermitis]|uniref:Uncharacterized protein n=1 Tax=Nocardia macrotermitis TaxID=2585198 RepID=A0A7K0DAV8_9NOCA|nr:hypothetical protein [Nocardia macrotermitis]MQY22651.1 hypothetical protein [Nocardia macrotermitis]